jgi:hypothetical protein
MLRDAPDAFFSRRRQNLRQESDAELLFERSLFRCELSLGVIEASIRTPDPKAP